MQTVMKNLSVITAIVLLVVLQAGQPAMAAKVHRESNKNLVLWCGHAASSEQARFPYLAAIRKYRTSKGQNYEVATVYKKGKVVFRQYVSIAQKGDKQVRYSSAGDEFALNIGSHSHHADLRAVVRDEDGIKMIATGSIPCGRAKRI